MLLKTIQATSPMLTPAAVSDALLRLAPHIHRTPLLSCSLLNEWLGHELLFKAEGLQKVGAFKIRGALNALLRLQEEGRLPKRVVAFSSGNHAQAVALAGKMLGVETTIVMPRYVSLVKQQATRGYGAQLLLTDTRQEAEALAAQIASQGAWFLHPSDDDDVIAGQGTACLEALQDGAKPDAIFTACGGGGLLAGTYLAAGDIPVYAAEPMIANDAAQSYRSGSIIAFNETPMTMADGARTLHVSPRTFDYLQRLAGFYEIEETRIIYWTQWLQHLLKISIEPTSALAMAAAQSWLAGQPTKKRALVILSGGNIDAQSYRQIWAEDHLATPPVRNA